MIQKLNNLMEKSKSAFLYVYLVYAVLATVSQITQFVEICGYMDAAFIVYRLLLVLWYVGIYGAGVYFLIKKNNEHTRLYFTLVFGYSIVAHFYGAWTWVSFLDEIYNPNFVNVTYRILSFFVALTGAVFGVCFILELFLKKNFFKYGVCGGLLGLALSYLLLLFVYLIGTFTGDLSWTGIFATLSSIAFVVIMAIGLPIVKGEMFEYSSFKSAKTEEEPENEENLADEEVEIEIVEEVSIEE